MAPFTDWDRKYTKETSAINDGKYPEIMCKRHPQLRGFEVYITYFCR